MLNFSGFNKRKAEIRPLLYGRAQRPNPEALGDDKYSIVFQYYRKFGHAIDDSTFL